jgi:hypothetical protein
VKQCADGGLGQDASFDVDGAVGDRMLVRGAQDGVGGCGTSQPVDVSTECAFVDVVTGADDQESGVGDVSQLGGVVDHAVGVVGSVGVDEDRAIGRHDGASFTRRGCSSGEGCSCECVTRGSGGWWGRERGLPARSPRRR